MYFILFLEKRMKKLSFCSILSADDYAKLVDKTRERRTKVLGSVHDKR